MNLRLEIDRANQSTGTCGCCGQLTSRVWGYVYEADVARAAYFVEWTPKHTPAQANFDIIIGEWGDGTTASQREAVSLEYRALEGGPAFMVVDATTRPFAASSLIGRALPRNEVVGTPMAPSVFAICDAIWLEDPRISELRPG